jgi:prepilin-type N-terminal cleavage/methylation domain-containing protein
MKNIRRNLNRKGFTMIELMVVVVVIGILASIAVPMYGKYVRNARLTEASGRVGEIITAAKAYAQENQDASGDPTWPSGAVGIVDLSNSESFSYAITAGAGADANTTALTIEATGLASGRMAGVTLEMTVNSLGANGSAPVVAGL